MTDSHDYPAGTMFIRRGLDGKDTAYVKVLTGWQECDPPPRSERTRDGASELWIPADERRDDE